MNNEASITRFADTIYSRWIRWPNGPYWVCKRFVKFEFDFIYNQIKSKAVMVILSYTGKYRNNLVPSAPLTYTLQSCVRPFSSSGFSFASWPVTTVYSYTSVVSLISNLQNDIFNLKNIWLNFSNITMVVSILLRDKKCYAWSEGGGKRLLIGRIPHENPAREYHMSHPNHQCPLCRIIYVIYTDYGAVWDIKNMKSTIFFLVSCGKTFNWPLKNKMLLKSLNWMNLLENDNGSNLIFIHYFEYHIAETIAFLKIKLWPAIRKKQSNAWSL